MENNSADENSNDGLQIVIDSPNPKPKKRSRNELNEADREIIACMEKDLDENLEEKAEKANLTIQHVKSIIKEVVRNEHVQALVRHAENPDENDEPITVYEPKFTRAKTKLLFSSNTKPIIPWSPPPKPPSDVHKLLSEELQEDSSGDEYVPENINNKSTCSESELEISTMSKDEEANIALRTRSKLSLSHTPLEVIEEAFMPPDITTDMYDMDCDDDVWRDFLKTFTQPLDEVSKLAEDEDHDPEYNILADEEIDEVDTEELRADRAVTVSRKEFNCLIAELFEFTNIYESNKNKSPSAGSVNLSIENFNESGKSNHDELDSENDPNICIKKCQIPLLAQQMRQHVQMLTQSFLLAYEHPEYSDIAVKSKEMLFSIKSGSEEKTRSIYHVPNLTPALKLIEDWEQLFASKNEDVTDTKQYVDKVITESINAKLAGTEYIVTFPPLLMKTVSNSEAFIYPNLLPRIPFKSLHIMNKKDYFFTPGEENLIAHFLEHAIPIIKEDPFHLTKSKAINMKHVVHYLHNLLMPLVDAAKIRRRIEIRKRDKSEEKPFLLIVIEEL